MALKKLVDLFEEKVDAKTKTMLASLGVIDAPQLGVGNYENTIADLTRMGGKSAICMVRVGDIYTDTTYNRGDNINYPNIVKNMKKKVVSLIRHPILLLCLFVLAENL